MADLKAHYVKLRPQADGSARPRFEPGPRERALGFVALDLKHPDGSWLTREQALGWSANNYQLILKQRESGRRLKAPPAPRGVTVADLVADFKADDEFKLPRERGGYSDESRRDIATKLNAVLYRPRVKRGAELEPEIFATRPVSAIGKPEVKEFYLYLCKQRGHAMARGAIMWLSAAFEWGSLSTKWRLKFNPCQRLDLPTPAARIRIASDAEIRALVAAADDAELMLPELGDAVMLALFTGQRQRDVLELMAAKAAPGRNRFEQGKTGAIVSIPETPALAARLAAAAERKRRSNRIADATVVIHMATGRRFNSSTFRHKFSEVRAKALAQCPSLADFEFRDLRDTAVTWYARAGSSIPEIASITGHSLRSIHSILKHYLALDEHLADSAVAKLVKWMDEQGMAV